MFELPKYHAPDFSLCELVNAPNVKYALCEYDGVAPENYHSTSMFPEYFKVDGKWLLAEESRMDSSVVITDEGLAVVENRNLKVGDKVILGRTENGEDGIFVHTRGFVSEDDLKEWVGKSIVARVITAEQEGRKLVLSAKELLREKEAEERKEAAALVKVGMVTEGTVETIKDYGAFVNLGKGVTGLLHVSQISQKRIKTPSEVLKEGDTVKVKVIKVADGRISLSMKALEESASPEAAEEREEVSFKLPKSENIGTGLGDLLKGLKLN